MKSKLFSLYFRWNDPMTQHELNECSKFVKSNIFRKYGFISNAKRGTGYYYGEQATIKFCQRNQFDYILRAHEVFPQGFQFFIQGRVVSVFSASNYSGGRNAAAILHVCKHRIRVIRIHRDNVGVPDKAKKKTKGVVNKK